MYVIGVNAVNLHHNNLYDVHMADYRERLHKDDVLQREAKHDRLGKGGIAMSATIVQLYQRMICEVSSWLAERQALPWKVQPACAE
jgi:hypothetical protein